MAGGNALDKGLDILEALLDSDEPLRYGEIETRVGLAPASFARYLKTLHMRGYVRRQPDGRYALGLAALRLGVASRDVSPLLLASGETLDALVEATGETAELVEFDAEGFVFLDRRESPRSVVLRARPGSRFAYAGDNAITFVALAYDAYGCVNKSESKGVRAVSAKTTEAIRNAGVYDLIQNNGEAWRAAAPVFDRDGGCVGCLSIAAPAFRIDDETREACRRQLLDAARAVTAKLS